ncbi:MAG TPA: hypothetical protein VKN76_00900 [Kiloniellaceae bacterium]|nr:hypothetical protein [Kiloniellaceae bacterium]
MRTWVAAIAIFGAWLSVAEADPPEILSVRALLLPEGSWQFDVRLRHPDEGWDHYADRWDVMAPDGQVLGTRVLLHPHVEEQPFTRGLSGVAIPDEIAEVTLRARCSRDGYQGSQEFTVTLER